MSICELRFPLAIPSWAQTVTAATSPAGSGVRHQDTMKDLPESKAVRISLFGEAVMFITKGGWIGLKLKGSPYHIIVGFTPNGMSAHKTIEKTQLHVPIADVPNQSLQQGLGEFFSEILRNEIDPTAPKFKGWTVLIPRTSPDTPLARKLITEDRKKLALTLKPLIEMGPVGALHAMHEVIPMSKVKGRQFKWALAYPTRNWREFSGRTMRWLHGWNGRYYMVSDRKRNRLLQKSFGLAL